MIRPAIVLMFVLAFAPVAMAQHNREISQGWGWAGIAASTLDDQGAPAPSPTPKPGDPCRGCNGTGRVGDGRVSTTCLDCNGTGKVVGQKVSELLERVADRLVSAPSPSDRVIKAQPIARAATVLQDCPGGICPLPGVRSEPVTRQECPGGVCPVPAQQTVKRYTQPSSNLVRKGWLFRR